MAKKRIAVIFGGTSPEHEISCSSACSVIRNLSAELYEVICIGMTKKGKLLFYPGDLTLIENGQWEKHPDCCACVFSVDGTKHGLYKLLEDQTVSFLPLDCVFPVLYGKEGEDGTIQGVLTASRIPYVGSGVSASALCMDKAFTHMVLNSAGIKTAAYLTMKRARRLDIPAITEQIQERFGFPVFIKPANANSAGGLFRAMNEEELERGIKLAFVHDDKVLIEESVVGVQVKCAVIGNDQPEASVLGEINFDGSEDPDGSAYEGLVPNFYIPARISQDLSYRIREIAVQAFRTLDCAGMACIDFLITPAEEIYLNQVNTIPGFSEVSIFPRLWDTVGIFYGELLERLITLATDRAEAVE